MNLRIAFALAVAMFLLLMLGCSQEKITRPEVATTGNEEVGQGEIIPPVVSLCDLQKTASGSATAPFADVAVTNFTGPQVVYPGDTLILSVTLANIGDLGAVGPFDAWIGVLGTSFEIARRTLPGLAAGDSRSGMINFMVPAKELTAAILPGLYTIYCTHNCADPMPANDYLLFDVELMAVTPGTFVHIPPGTFIMGSPTNEPGRDTGEIQHQVTLTHGFFCQIAEVTNQQYMELAQWAYDHNYVTATDTSLRDNLDGSTKSLKNLGYGDYEISFSNGVFSCSNPTHPVKYVSWYGSAAYCDWLSLQQGFSRAYDHATWECNGGNPYGATGFRLPTEAEWEYSCRAGSTAAFANGPITQLNCDPIDPNLDAIGWHCGNADDWTQPVAQKLPNAWGLYDMHGNLYEWCNDWLAPYGGTVTDPVGPSTGSYRVLRGGSWGNYAQDCRSGCRFFFYPAASGGSRGFRPVRSSD